MVKCSYQEFISMYIAKAAERDGLMANFMEDNHRVAESNVESRSSGKNYVFMRKDINSMCSGLLLLPDGARMSVRSF